MTRTPSTMVVVEEEVGIDPPRTPTITQTADEAHGNVTEIVTVTVTAITPPPPINPVTTTTTPENSSNKPEEKVRPPPPSALAMEMAMETIILETIRII